MLRGVAGELSHAELPSGLDETVREDARRMLVAALEAEFEECVAALVSGRGEAGRQLVVRNGHSRARKVTTVAGAVEVSAPRVDNWRVEEVTGERRRSAA